MKTRTLLLAGVAALFLATGAARAYDAELPDQMVASSDRVSLGEAHGERYAQIAAEFVRLNVDVIVTTGPAALQAKKATSVIPIVLALSGDPVGAGLVASLARPAAQHGYADPAGAVCVRRVRCRRDYQRAAYA